MENQPKVTPEPGIRIQFRVSAEENELLRSRANQAGLGMSEFLRRAGLGVPIDPRLSASDRENLYKIGGNLNQATRWSNKEQKWNTEIEELIKLIKEILKETK